LNHRPNVHNGFNFKFFKQGKIFRETQVYGNNYEIVSNQQPLKKISIYKIFFFVVHNVQSLLQVPLHKVARAINFMKLQNSLFFLAQIGNLSDVTVGLRFSVVQSASYV
jgi:hypothetical protein